MESTIIHRKIGKKYFNTQSKDPNIDSDSNSKAEKVSLTFSLTNCTSNAVYHINASFLDDKEILKTEKKKTTGKSITFNSRYIVNYFFEKEQNLKIKIFKNGKRFPEFDTTLGCIIGSKDSIFITPINNKKFSESLKIKAEIINKDNSSIIFSFNLRTKNVIPNYFTLNKLFYIITCKNIRIYSSEDINTDGIFEQTEIPISLLLPEFTINIYDNNKNIIGTYTTTPEKIKINPNFSFEIPIEKNNILIIESSSIYKENFSFLDYIKSGVRIGLSIGIDFTGSNGHPLDSGTLHSIVDNKPNDYEKAITACGNIVAYYDYDQLFPVYGFGAIIPGNKNNNVSMCFNINFNNNNPNIYLISNIIEIYHKCLDQITFSGPTEFTPIINKVISEIKKDNNPLKYEILMILTDGVIDDLENTIDALVEGSYLPLSVIIIGIGDADFTKMKILDGDDVPLCSRNGKKRMRDLVQFVPFNKFENDEKKLAMEVLEEIPDQIIEYYRINNYKPENIRELIKIKGFDDEGDMYTNTGDEDDEGVVCEDNPYSESNNDNVQESFSENKDLGNSFILLK